MDDGGNVAFYACNCSGAWFGPDCSVPFQFTFTNMGAAGPAGPTALTYGRIDTVISLSNGIQYWTVPATGWYSIEAAGAGTANNATENTVQVGYGAVLTASVHLIAGQLIAILIGQQGISVMNVAVVAVLFWPTSLRSGPFQRPCLCLLLAVLEALDMRCFGMQISS